MLLDEDLNPWLLEVNASPSLTATDAEDYRLKYHLLEDVLNVIDMEGRSVSVSTPSSPGPEGLAEGTPYAAQADRPGAASRGPGPALGRRARVPALPRGRLRRDEAPARRPVPPAQRDARCASPRLAGWLITARPADCPSDWAIRESLRISGAVRGHDVALRNLP